MIRRFANPRIFGTGNPQHPTGPRMTQQPECHRYAAVGHPVHEQGPVHDGRLMPTPIGRCAGPIRPARHLRCRSTSRCTSRSRRRPKTAPAGADDARACRNAATTRPTASAYYCPACWRTGRNNPCTGSASWPPSRTCPPWGVVRKSADFRIHKSAESRVCESGDPRVGGDDDASGLEAVVVGVPKLTALRSYRRFRMLLVTAGGFQ